MRGPTEDRFEEWLRAPLPAASPDARYDVRRARPSEFDAIYDLVDEAFGVRRSRAKYDWIYRKNPYGLARCWIVIEKATGKLVSTGADYPWPAAHGGTRLPGFATGDSAVAGHLQRQGIEKLRLDVRRTHPWRDESIHFAWPNERSVGRVRGHGFGEKLVGPIPRAALDLHARTRLARRGWPRLVAGGVGAAIDAWATALRGASNGPSPELRIAEVSRFDERFDPVTERCMRWDGFWFPHDAHFLNWRYLGHPTQEYRALALLRGEEVVCYCVLALDGRRATLMELATPGEPADVPAALLAAATEAARDAGCDRIEFFATPGWRHWPLLRASGFAERASQTLLFLRDRAEESSRIEDWQLVPGDHDIL
jgi:hypothetical protein